MSLQEPPQDAHLENLPSASLPSVPAPDQSADTNRTNPIPATHLSSSPVVETDTITHIQLAIDLPNQSEADEPERILLTADRHEVTKIVATEQVLLHAEQEAMHEAKHLLNEAEEHESVQFALLEAKTFGSFWLKFLNDWVFNFASGLAYHLLTAMFPVAIILLLIIGFLSRNAQDQASLLRHLDVLFPNVLSNQDILAPALTIIHKDAGFLSVLAIVLAILNGSRLFVSIEDCFDVIYHTPARSFWTQNLMAICMLLIFVILIPVMLLASSVGLGGFFWGVVASWLLFEAIYLFIPNQRISLKNSWRGALIAAVALQIYVILFPIYARHFLGSYSGTAGFAIILLIFFYYFAVILLLGAEVNAYYAEDIRGNPANIAGLVHRATQDADKARQIELERRKSEIRAMKR